MSVFLARTVALQRSTACFSAAAYHASTRSLATTADPYGFAGGDEEAAPMRRSRRQVDESDTRRGRREVKKEAYANERSKVMFAQEAAALSSRIGESLDQELVAEALTDGTAEEEINNARLAEAGNLVLESFTKTYLAAKYPKLPGECINDIHDHLTGEEKIFEAAKALGIPAIVRAGEDTARAEAVARAFRALVGAIQQQNGTSRAREFVQDTVVSQLKTMDVAESLQFTEPITTLKKLVGKEFKKKAHFSMLAEAGRKTHQPTFVMGAFVGEQLLAKGAAVSIQGAKRDAARAAIISLLATPVDVKDLSQGSPSSPEAASA